MPFSEFSLLYDFNLAQPDGINGRRPISLVLSADGNTLYGTTSGGGVGGDAGVVFSLPKTGGPPTILYDFNTAVPGGSNGLSPNSLVLSADGNTLYGTTQGGGVGGVGGDSGVVFSLSKTGGELTILYDFSTAVPAKSNGAYPITLVLSKDGNTLYGTTYYGGVGGDAGVVFTLPKTGGEPTILYDFSTAVPAGINGKNPGFLVLSKDGNILYGTTYGDREGGNTGVVFSLPKTGGEFTILYDFNTAVPAGSNGAITSSLILSKDGNALYGTMSEGGSGGGNYGNGVVFALLDPQPVITNICFPAGTPITTDQGVLPIDQLDPRVHTIRGQVIQYITQTLTGDPYLICLEKDALGRNVPTQRTIMSKEHQIEFNGQLVPAERFLNFSREVKKVKYTGEILYNVLLAQHGTMTVNGLQCETLHPANLIAKLYTKKMPATEREAIIIQMNTSLQKRDFVGYKNAIQKLA